MRYFISSNIKKLSMNWEKYVFHWEKWNFELIMNSVHMAEQRQDLELRSLKCHK